MAVTQELVDAAEKQARKRFPKGWAGAAAILTECGEILTSVCFDSLNEATHLCHEVGAICEANRRGLNIVATVCVSRESDEKPFAILTPCGVCQERLATWGLDVHAAVPLAKDCSKWASKSLREIQPYYWRKIYDQTDK